jgi:hypothetical protein
LKFFLNVVASKEQVETGLLLHSLRLIGNSCADTGMFYRWQGFSVVPGLDGN